MKAKAKHPVPSLTTPRGPDPGNPNLGASQVMQPANAMRGRLFRSCPCRKSIQAWEMPTWTDSGCRRFSFEEIRRATKEFEEKIGGGGHSDVFLGVDPGTGQKWAVKWIVHPGGKCISCGEPTVDRALIQREVDAVSLHSHPNILKLIGSCQDVEDLILVYEYAPHGSLGSRLRGTTEHEQLSFPERLEIAIGTAEALEYLHCGGPDNGMGGGHFIVGSDNIFLDGGLKAQLGNFGRLNVALAPEIPHIVRALHRGYLAPDTMNDPSDTPASDVYSLGVVLLELATGRPAVAVTPTDQGQRREFLAVWAREEVKRPELWVRAQTEEAMEAVADPRLLSSGAPRCCIHALFLLGARCVELHQNDPVMRPIIGQVLGFLRKIKEHYGEWARSPTTLCGPLDVESLRNIHKAPTPPRPAAGSHSEGDSNLQPAALQIAMRSSTPGAALTLSTALREFTSAELASATSNFKKGRIVGSWRLGTVYKGLVSTSAGGEGGARGQMWVAVKLLDLKKGFRVPKAEIQGWGGLHHPRVERLVGFGYTKGGTTVLVHRLVPNGSLASHLFDGDSSPGSGLTWIQRVSIALDIAKALEYLHNHRIVHGNLSACTILLDMDLQPRICDFVSFPNGEKGPMNTSGSPGYVASEYAQTGQPTTASDVYAFGVVLLELLSGRQAGGDQGHDQGRPAGEGTLASWAATWSEGLSELRPFLDSRLGKDSHRGAMRLAEAARQCCQQDAKARPTMSAVFRS